MELINKIKTEFSASLFAANPLELSQQIQATINAGIQCLHLDIMDFNYVNNIALNPQTIHAIASKFPKLNLDIHLMVNNIEKILPIFEHCNIRNIFFHPKTNISTKKIIEQVQAKHNIQSSITINPNQNPNDFLHLLPNSNYCLIMGVTPGFSGQKFQQKALQNIRIVQQYILKHKLKTKIAVDGGVNIETIEQIIQYNPEHLVLGSCLFKNPGPEKNILGIYKKINQH